ncbi:MAG: DUF1697 domain-containing protein [Alphaproteobacteria bacterium]|nr:DUF1697 domain-containing protein [Alphaproteobacteria bacterium]
MNLGNRRLTNVDLAAALVACGCREPRIYQASGNAVVEDPRGPEALRAAVEEGLATALGYSVPTFVRSADAVRAIASADPFPGRQMGGKLQVGILRQAPSGEARSLVASLDGEADALALGEQELFWWPSGSILDSSLDLKALERALGPWTQRTHGTVQRLTKKYFS